MVKLNTFMFNPNANEDPSSGSPRSLNSSNVVLELGKRDPTGSLSSTSFIFQKGNEDSSSIDSHEQRATDAVHNIIRQFDENTSDSDSDSSSLATLDTTATDASSEQGQVLPCGCGDARQGAEEAREALGEFLQRQAENDRGAYDSYSETSDRTSDLNSVSSGLTGVSQDLARVSSELGRITSDLSSITSESSELSTDSTDSSDLTESTESTEETADTMMGFAKYLDGLTPSQMENPSESGETYDVSPEELARLQEFVKVLYPRVMETQAQTRGLEMRGGRASRREKQKQKQEKDVPRDFIVASSSLPQEMEQQSLRTSTLPMQGGAIRAGSDVVFGTCADSVASSLTDLPTQVQTKGHYSHDLLHQEHSPLVHYGGSPRPYSDETSSFSSYITDATNSVLNDYAFTGDD